MKLKQVQYICPKIIVLVSISLLFYFFSSLCRGHQSIIFCIVSFDFNWSRSPKIQHPFALVCHCETKPNLRLLIVRNGGSFARASQTHLIDFRFLNQPIRCRPNPRRRHRVLWDFVSGPIVASADIRRHKSDGTIGPDRRCDNQKVRNRFILVSGEEDGRSTPMSEQELMSKKN